MSKSQTIMQLLYSIAASAEAAIALLEEETGQQPSENEPCAHPKDQRKDFSTMGFERWQCKTCGFVHEQEREEVEG